MDSVRVRMLGGFEVFVDGVLVPEAAWTYGRAKDLVKLLGLAKGHRLARDQVVDALWAELDAQAGMANLHKAAHHARRALGDNGAVVLREGVVALAPKARVESDVERFEASGDPDHCGGELLPDDRYAEWAEERREQLRAAYLRALRAAGRWEQLAGEEPGDEAAQCAVMRGRLASGDRSGALRAFERLRAALDELGLRPGIEALALQARIVGGAAFDEALAEVELALAEAPVAERVPLLAKRADLLLAMGDRGAPAAFAHAAAAAGPAGVGLRIRQAWANLAVGDPAAAQATLAALEPRSNAERVAYLVARAAAAWYGGDAEGARAAAQEAQPLAIAAGLEREARTASQVLAMVAHSQGAWPEALRLDLETSLGAPDVAETLFDGHLCVAQYALTSGEPHEPMQAMVAALHADALRKGARRAQALAATILGEISLVAGRLPDASERLREAVRVSREIGALTAEALATVRLGEAARAGGDLAEGDSRIADAVVMAAWSPLSEHLQPLTYAALLRAAESGDLGQERLDEADAAMRGTLVCAYCGTAFRVAAAIAAARAGLPERAAALLAAAERSTALWRAGPWPAALDEARGELALARREQSEARARLQASQVAFALHGRHLDSDRVAARLAGMS